MSEKQESIKDLFDALKEAYIKGDGKYGNYSPAIHSVSIDQGGYVPHTITLNNDPAVAAITANKMDSIIVSNKMPADEWGHIPGTTEKAKRGTIGPHILITESAILLYNDRIPEEISPDAIASISDGEKPHTKIAVIESIDKIHKAYEKQDRAISIEELSQVLGSMLDEASTEYERETLEELSNLLSGVRKIAKDKAKRTELAEQVEENTALNKEMGGSREDPTI